MIGRRRPVEQDALRILTIVHQLGWRPAGERGPRRCIDTENQLLALDHLVRRPVDLAYVLLLEARARPEPEPQLARRVRHLVGATPTRRRRASLRSFERASWVRCDDALALLGCRALLRVEVLPAVPDLRYLLTARGAAWLEETANPAADSLAPIRERCRMLRRSLPAAVLERRGDTSLETYLRRTGRRLAALRQEEQIHLEDDLVGHLFEEVFHQRL